MLKYAVAFCIISSCNSFPNRLVDDSAEIILAQRSPAAVIFEQEYTWGRKTSVANRKAIKILEELDSIFEPRTWIIHGLWAMLSYIRVYKNCHDVNNRTLTYDGANLNSTFREKLIKIWPNLDEQKTDDQIWQKNYEKYGSCIQLTPLDYFQDAMTLMDNHNIGKILERSEIVPGGTYEFSMIFDPIKKHFGVNIYVRCLPDQDSYTDEQYLLDVHICYNIKYELKDCDYAATYLCNEEKSIFYPGL